MAINSKFSKTFLKGFAQQQATNRIKGITNTTLGSIINPYLNKGKYDESKKNKNANVVGLHYPLELRGESNTPVIQLSSYGSGSTSIWFPCPANLSVTDTANYDTIDFGLIGISTDELVGAGQDIASGGDWKDTASKVLSTGAKRVNELAGQAAALATKRIQQPNTGSLFTGNGIRTYSFAFKMVARSARESQMIRDIHERFRELTYATGDSIELSFPSTWRVSFLDKDGNINDFLPLLNESYLTSVETTFNESSPIFHKDGSPLEVNLTLSFQEVRALSRSELKSGTSRDIVKWNEVKNQAIAVTN